MPISTDLSGSPTFDDYDPSKAYYKVLFQPGVSVQVRELNQLQSILQNQIEMFGDNILKEGSIVSGCNFRFIDYYPFCKISDLDSNGNGTNPAAYVGLYVKNANNLIGYVTNYLNGYEITSPNLKTLYLNFINSGDNNSLTNFNPGDTLTVYSPNNALFGINIVAGSSGFSNSDTVVISSALGVRITSGAFSNGDYLFDPSTGANVQIIGITNNGSNNFTLSIQPKVSDLANTTMNANSWTFNLFDSVRNASNTATAVVNNIYGSGAKVNIVTDSVGSILNTILANTGFGYSVLPYITVYSANNSSGISGANLVALNYLTQLTVPAVSNATGNGYAFAVSNGVIYQKGYFLNVNSQLTIVSNYTNTPNNVSAGFATVEQIVTSDSDSSLLDNATGAPNYAAPGANRLQLVPQIVISDTPTARANTNFLTLVEWNNGFPYEQKGRSQYSIIGDAIAQNLSDASGNFVLDQFQVTTKSVANATNESQFYTVVVDPGTAYIGGYKTQTLSNYLQDVKKGTDTKINNGQNISLNTDTYIRVNNLGGVFQFSTGDLIQFYDTPKGFLSNTALVTSGNTSPVGNLIGSARIKSLVFENGTPGDSGAVYRLYLFNMSTVSGANFKNAKSVYYNGSTYKGIADIILVLDGTTNSTIAKISGTSNSTLIFQTGLESIKNTNNSIYSYRTLDQNATVGNNGILTKSIASTPSEFFPYSGTLTSTQMFDLYVAPIANNIVAYTALTGTATVNNTSNTLVGSGTVWGSSLAAGDYITVAANSSTSVIKKVTSVTNNTFLNMDSPASFSNTTCSIYRTFPQNVPVPFGTRSGLSANVNSNGNILSLNFGMTFAGTTSTNTALAITVQRTGITSTAKVANRSNYVLLNLSNTASNTVGPWCLGVADAFRLRNVFVGSNSSVNTSSVDVTTEFYIDHNQNENYFDLSNLVLNPKTSLSLNSNNFLLVCFDYFTSTGTGYYDTVSYLGTANATQIASLDSANLASLTTAATSFEVPEMYTHSGNYYDLLNCIDFRPAAVATVSPSTLYTGAPVNPPYTLSFGNTADPTNTKKFPVPNSILNTNVEYYIGRTDSVIVGPDGIISVLNGNPSADLTKRYEPTIPNDALHLQDITVPAYPNITVQVSPTVANIINTRVINEIAGKARLTNHMIIPNFDANTVALNQPKAYTMSEISGLERRIKTLEYYQLLSTLETSITNTVIPSSINPAIDRFKFGFFADDFSTTLYSQKTDPEYAASIETANTNQSNILSGNNLPQLASNYLVPSKFVFGLNHVLPDLNPQYYDYPIVTQSNATEPVSLCALVPIFANNVTSGTTNGYFYEYRSGATSQFSPQGQYFYDVRNISLSKTTGGNCTMYFGFYNDPQIYITKANGAVVNSNSARNLTQAEIDYLTNSPYTANFFYQAARGGINGVGLRSGLSSHGFGFLFGCGALDFYHDPSTGSDYTIEVNTPNGTASWTYFCYQWMIRGPVDFSSGTTLVMNPCGATQGCTFNGIMSINSNLNSTVYQNSTAFDVVSINCSGLKPLTTHYFFFGGVQNSSNVRQVGKNFGDPLTTDLSGKISLQYYFNPLSTNTGTGSANPVINLSNYTQNQSLDATYIPNGSQNLIEFKTVGSGASGQLNLNTSAN